MNTLAAASAAVTAAALFATGTALQYRAVAPSQHGDLRRAVASPMWLLGTGVLAVGLGLHALALHEGPLTLVQPLLILGLLFALPASRFAGGPSIRSADLCWALLLVIAVTAFLVTATPAAATGKDIDTAPAFAAFGLSLGGVIVCVLVARAMSGRLVSTMLGAAAGIALAASAALIKVCTDLAARNIASLLSGWQLYALILVGGSGLLLSQMAYRAGPMTASLPAINTLNPVVSVTIGWGVFDERFRTGGTAVALEAISLLLALLATVALSRTSPLAAPGERQE